MSYRLKMASQIGHVPKGDLYFIGVVDEKLSLARDFSVAVNTVQEREKLESQSRSFDVVFEAVGGRSQKVTLDQAIDLLRPGGRCIVLGLSGNPVPIDFNKVVNKGLTLRGSVRSRLEHFMKVVDLLKNAQFRDLVKRVISARRFEINSAEDLVEAFKYADTEEGEARTRPGRVLVYFP